MKFCTECQNMYYISIDETNPNNLNYYCRFCGHKDEHITEDSVVVLKTQFKKSEQKFNHMVNKYTKYDPTLPRTSHLKCPNDACISNGTGTTATVALDEEKPPSSATSFTDEATSTATTHGVPSDVVYIRYDDVKLKFIYICTHCDTRWKNDLQSQ